MARLHLFWAFTFVERWHTYTYTYRCVCVCFGLLMYIEAILHKDSDILVDCVRAFFGPANSLGACVCVCAGRRVRVFSGRKEQKCSWPPKTMKKPNE